MLTMIGCGCHCTGERAAATRGIAEEVMCRKSEVRQGTGRTKPRREKEDIADISSVNYDEVSKAVVEVDELEDESDEDR